MSLKENDVYFENEYEQAMEKEISLRKVFISWLVKGWISGKEYVRLCETNGLLIF